MNNVADFWARHSDEGVDLKARATSKLTVISIKIDPKYANAVPQMTSKEYEELKQSIKEDGLHYKLVVKYDGYYYILLDGHHRYKACQELGRPITEEDIEVKKFDDPLDEEEFVHIINAIRRHYNDYQKFETGLVIKRIEMERAKRRQSEAGRIYGKGKDNNTNNNSMCSNEHNLSDENSYGIGKSRDISAKKVGIPPTTFTRAEKIHKCASEDTKQKLREGKAEINTEYSKIQKQEKKQKLVAEALKLPRLSDGVQIIHGDFRDKCNTIPANSIPLIFTDPSYAEKDLPDYKDLGREAMRMLVDGGFFVTNVGEGYQDIAIEYVKESGLKFWNTITVLLAGNHSRIHYRKMFADCKTLLVFVKGSEPREGIPTKYMPNLIKSTIPDKSLHGRAWEQSVTESEFIVRHLTFPNETVLDCMCGTGTTGIAALKLGRQFIGIDIDENECKNADINIRRYFKGEQSKP